MPRFWFAPCAFSKPASNGTIRGYVLIPNDIDMGAAPKEAKVYIYLKDDTPVNGTEGLPWDAPVKKVLTHDLESLKRHRVAFEFRNLPEGLFGVSVLADTGRPHVPPGSMNFTAFPGDYAAGTREKVSGSGNQTIEVAIEDPAASCGKCARCRGSTRTI